MAVHLRPIVVALVASIITFVLTLIGVFTYLFIVTVLRPEVGVGVDALAFVKQVSIPFSVLVFLAVLLVMIYKGR